MIAEGIKKKLIVISAVNLFEGGPLSILKDCLKQLNSAKYIKEYKILALVHKKSLFNENLYSNIEFIEYPKARKSYFFRLYYEYIYFRTFAKKNKVYFWFSLHDITPKLKDVKQAVYCHNPSPFNKLNFKDIYIQPTQFLFRLFYKYLYGINIKENEYVIVQQMWIKEKFHEMFGIEKDKIVVAKPQIPEISIKYLYKDIDRKGKIFFFPTFPRPFKNIEVVCNAVKLLNSEGLNDFKVLITINGTENKYAKGICNKYKGEDNIKFIGLLKREDVYKLYSECDCLIFPSKLETWGLPISEFKQYNKPLFVANLPYAKETVEKYEKVKFFEPTDAVQLASFMADLIKTGTINYDKTESIIYPAPFAKDWEQLFSILLTNKQLYV